MHHKLVWFFLAAMQISVFTAEAGWTAVLLP